MDGGGACRRPDAHPRRMQEMEKEPIREQHALSIVAIDASPIEFISTGPGAHVLGPAGSCPPPPPHPPQLPRGGKLASRRRLDDGGRTMLCCVIIRPLKTGRICGTPTRGRASTAAAGRPRRRAQRLPPAREGPPRWCLGALVSGRARSCGPPPAVGQLGRMKSPPWRLDV
jgi:hypothetical protein